MPSLAGPFYAAALLLAIAGAPKVVRPASAVRALASARLPAAAPLVRALGAAEVVVGIGAVVVGSTTFALLVAASYLAFAGFVALALRRGGVLASCGCFGRDDTPPTALHVVVDLAAGGVALAVAARPLGGVGAILRDQPLAGVPFVALAALCVWFAYLALAGLPALVAAGSRG